MTLPAQLNCQTQQHGPAEPPRSTGLNICLHCSLRTGLLS